jgi:hypothetical protein
MVQFVGPTPFKERPGIELETRLLNLSVVLSNMGAEGVMNHSMDARDSTAIIRFSKEVQNLCKDRISPQMRRNDLKSLDASKLVKAWHNLPVYLQLKCAGVVREHGCDELIESLLGESLPEKEQPKPRPEPMFD